MKLGTLLAIWGGKSTIALSRLLGWGGSNLPGTLARRIDSSILRTLSSQPQAGVLAVTGTNGKTTSAKMLSAILEVAGRTVVHNRAGANLIGGLTAAFLTEANWLGRVQGDMALLEIDEATMPTACREVPLRAAIVTNFFRDQLDRYGELEHTVNFVARGLDAMAKGSLAVLNADDPLCAPLGRRSGLQPLYYGMEDESRSTATPGHAVDVKHCTHCGATLEYRVYHYAHLGKYRCPSCGEGRPAPAVYVEKLLKVDHRGSTVRIVTPAGGFEVRIQIPGLYNVYNALAATAGAVAAGVGLDAIKKGLEETASGFGRMEMIPMRERDVFLALVKNPVGFNSVIATILDAESRKNLVICINDLYADGTDVSWLWDVDFESLAQHQDEINFILCSGLRAEDMAVRLKYAGVDPAKLVIESDLKKALDQGLTFIRPGEILYIMPTYTAMLQMREIMQKLGYTRKFWEV